jgi:hypothetical protein
VSDEQKRMNEEGEKRTIIIPPGEYIDIPLDQVEEIDYDPRFFKVEMVLLPDDKAAETDS